MYDRIAETTTSTGTGNIQLNGAISTYRRFSSVLAIGEETYYVIEHLTANEMEVGQGELISASIFQRNTVLTSSNSNSLVPFTSGTKRIFIDLPADYFNSIDSSTYTHNQESASTTWTITHNLNKHPSVTIVDSAGTVVEGDIVYTSVNVCTLTFSAAFSGKAYLN